MYQPSHFDESRPELLQQLMRRHPLALVITRDADGIHADPVPLLHDAASDDAAPHGVLRGHVARANPLWRRLADDPEVLVVFQGPHAYVSPGWYPAKAEHGKVVPTWNYCIVQARGAMRAIEDRDMAARACRRADRSPRGGAGTTLGRLGCAGAVCRLHARRDRGHRTADPADVRQVEGEPEPERSRPGRRGCRARCHRR